MMLRLHQMQEVTSVQEPCCSVFSQDLLHMFRACNTLILTLQDVVNMFTFIDIPERG